MTASHDLYFWFHTAKAHLVQLTRLITKCNCNVDILVTIRLHSRKPGIVDNRVVVSLTVVVVASTVVVVVGSVVGCSVVVANCVVVSFTVVVITVSYRAQC